MYMYFIKYIYTVQTHKSGWENVTKTFSKFQIAFFFSKMGHKLQLHKPYHETTMDERMNHIMKRKSQEFPRSFDSKAIPVAPDEKSPPPSRYTQERGPSMATGGIGTSTIEPLCQV